MSENASRAPGRLSVADVAKIRTAPLEDEFAPYDAQALVNHYCDVNGFMYLIDEAPSGGSIGDFVNDLQRDKQIKQVFDAAAQERIDAYQNETARVQDRTRRARKETEEFKVMLGGIQGILERGKVRFAALKDDIDAMNNRYVDPTYESVSSEAMARCINIVLAQFRERYLDGVLPHQKTIIDAQYYLTGDDFVIVGESPAGFEQYAPGVRFSQFYVDVLTLYRGAVVELARSLNVDSKLKQEILSAVDRPYSYTRCPETRSQIEYDNIKEIVDELDTKERNQVETLSVLRPIWDEELRTFLDPVYNPETGCYRHRTEEELVEFRKEVNEHRRSMGW